MTGTQVNKDMNAADNESKYNNILAAMKTAESDPYAGPLLKVMYREWWDRVMWGKIPSTLSFFSNIIFQIWS